MPNTGCHIHRLAALAVAFCTTAFCTPNLSSAEERIEAGAGAGAGRVEGSRRVIPLDDGWTLERSGVRQPIRIGDSWETESFEDFDGTGVYRRKLPREEHQHEPGRSGALGETGRWLLEIDGAATAATVRIADQPIGSHLGGWTPFRMDVSEWMREAADDRSPAREPLLEIVLDERVGHNTQGFLPIVVPHFGGIWKGVRLIHTAGEAYIDDMTLLLSGFDGDDAIDFQAQLRGPADVDNGSYEVGVRITGPTTDVQIDWQWFDVTPLSQLTGAPKTLAASGNDACLGAVTGTMTPPVIRRWEPGEPFLYDVEIAVRRVDTDQVVDRLARRAAIRHFTTDGRQLLVNGRPANIRGVLNWGYAPPRLAPSNDEAAMRRELQFARERGFNLMKFCLWTPPRRYLELADEAGMLTWIEYPTWHPDFSDHKYDELQIEFAELFHYDRNTASAILRSLTCETGHGASVDVIRGLYDLGHATIPGAIIEDDSSWIGWHRVHDFYDDHPYGNNHTWLAKLEELDSHIDAREAKPLVLGEAIAADTWEPVSRDGVALAPPHQSLSAERQADYLDEILPLHGLRDAPQLRSDSYDIALRMRKYQMEAFRWRLPDAGYVVSVIRDFPKAAMGLIDRWGNPKWPEEQFAWHGPIQLVLEDGAPVRSVAGGVSWKARICVAGEGKLPHDLELSLQWHSGDGREVTIAVRDAKSAERPDQAVFTASLPTPQVTTPKAMQLHATLSSKDEPVSRNAWRIWVVPPSGAAADESGARLYVSDSLAAPRLKELGIDEWQIAGNVADARRTLASGAAGPPSIMLASRFEPGLLEAIDAGARCVMLPDGQPGSLVTGNHWFLRGGPIVADHPLVHQLNREMLVDLQTFDLAGPVLTEFPLLGEGTPLVSLWDNHDLDRYRTHALLWESRIGKGLLVCSTLNHGHGSGEAGAFVLRTLIEHAAEPITARAMSDSSLKLLNSQLRNRQISLADQDWRFRRADTSEVEDGAVTDDAWLTEPVAGTDAWTPIEITSHWDGQGHGALDGWAFYRARGGSRSLRLARGAAPSGVHRRG